MGAYLSQPKTDKVSSDEFNDMLIVGASSMQGWRNSQEDAHNSILSFDKDTSFFAVYDGHGGAEVAAYCADKLPQFLKQLQAYKDLNIGDALIGAFLGFDRTLLEPEVIENLKMLAGDKICPFGRNPVEEEDEEDEEDLAELHEESHLPLHEVLEKYRNLSGGPSMPVLKRVKDENASTDKPQSPYLRGRRAAAIAAESVNKAVMDPDAKPLGSSTSAAAAAAASAAAINNDAGPSSAKLISTKMETGEPEEDSTVSSSSSSASKSNINNNNNNAISAVDTEAEAAATSKAENILKTNGTPNSNDSSHLIKESEQNGSVTSSEIKLVNMDVSSSGNSTKSLADDSTVSGSSDSTDRKQNGNIIGSSTSSISSTSKDPKRAEGGEESTDDDADYDMDNSASIENDARHMLEYSSDEDEDDDDEEEEEEDEEEDEEGEEEEEDDLETQIANEQFCANMIEEPGKDSGCTAVVALLQGRDLYVANAGDSRCVVCRNGKAIEMSLDHKPEDEEESLRIVKAGGRVTLDGRVNGGLNLSRAIGDHAYKMNLELAPEEQMISARPDIKKLIISPGDEFMVLACDGIWNYMSSEEVVDFVRQRMQDETKKMSQICEELFDNCLAPNTLGDGTGCDNMTAVIIRFQSKLLELPTKINVNETEDVILLSKKAVDAEAADGNLQKTLKRSASPTDDKNSNEAENINKNKRLKTEEDTLLSSSSTTYTTSSSTLNAATVSNSNDATISSNSSTLETSEAVSIGISEPKECDGNVTTATDGIAIDAVSST